MTIHLREEALQDERVQEILRGLAENKTREALAIEFGHKNYKTLDSYMRRKGFTWDSHKQTYVFPKDEIKHDMVIDRTKAGKVTLMLKKDGADIRSVSQRLGFKDHKEMAAYMKQQGYEWDGEQQNYVKQTGKIASDENEVEENSFHMTTPSSIQFDPGDVAKYLPLLEMLEKHKDRLLDLIVPGSETGKLPRYALPGVPTTKTIQMVTSLKEVVSAFSLEKNITQREVFEVALIEFFQKYGYDHHVESLLRQK